MVFKLWRDKAGRGSFIRAWSGIPGHSMIFTSLRNIVLVTLIITKWIQVCGRTLQDERRFNYSPVSDPWGEFALTLSRTGQVLNKLNSLETLVKEQHLTTRECTSKALRECLCIERGIHEKLCQQLQLVSEGISTIRDRKQADPPRVDVGDSRTCKLDIVIPPDNNTCYRPGGIVSWYGFAEHEW